MHENHFTKQIVVDGELQPITEVTELKLTKKQLEARDKLAAETAHARAWDGFRNKQRDPEIIATDWLVQRHLEQRELVAANLLSDTTLTEDEYLNILQYRQELRDITNTDKMPNEVSKPERP